MNNIPLPRQRWCIRDCVDNQQGVQTVVVLIIYVRFQTRGFIYIPRRAEMASRFLFSHPRACLISCTTDPDLPSNYKAFVYFSIHNPFGQHIRKSGEISATKFFGFGPHNGFFAIGLLFEQPCRINNPWYRMRMLLEHGWYATRLAISLDSR